MRGIPIRSGSFADYPTTHQEEEEYLSRRAGNLYLQRLAAHLQGAMHTSFPERVIYSGWRRLRAGIITDLRPAGATTSNAIDYSNDLPLASNTVLILRTTYCELKLITLNKL